jgi:hypothetical protein
MRITFPKDTDHVRWTRHIKNKMLFYGLSEQRIQRVFRTPDRREQGIAPETIGAMQKSRTRKTPEEIWILYQEKPSARRRTVTMISAWRYPGISKPGEPIPIPGDILDELINIR